MKYVFITGLGRSGTSFLSTLLSGQVSVASRHEYIGDREYWLLSWYLPGEVYSEQYLKREKKRIDREFVNQDVFIDVNGHLQHSVVELEKVFQGAQIFHLVRDGRKVVRSLYTRRNDRDIHLIPKDKQSVKRWMDGDKFEQICWNWNDATERLIATNKPIIKFEKLVSDYEYVKEHLLSPIGIAIQEEEWERARSNKVNKTRSNIYRYLYSKAKGKPFISTKLPEYDGWPRDKKEIFEEICGETMRELGYTL